MANNIFLKKSSIAGKIPTTGDLAFGELAINYADGKLYYKTTATTIDFIGNGGTFTNSLTISNLTQSVSTNTGALVVLGGVGIAGTATINTINVKNYIDLDSKPQSQIPYKEGRLWYDFYEHTINIWGATSGTNDIVTIGQREWVRCYNATTATITKGAPVYATGVHSHGPGSYSHHPTIALADASDVNKKDVIGLTAEDIPSGAHGNVVVRGWIEGINTANLTEGKRAHLGFASPGTLVESAPEYPNYPMDLGICLISNASSGTFYVQINDHSFERIRVSGNSYIDGSLTIGGSLNVLGTQTNLTVQNLQVDNNFIYLGAGDTVSTATYSGTGLNDLTFKGHFTGVTATTFYVKIDGTGTTDTFAWSLDNFTSTQASGIPITGGIQDLTYGIGVEFQAKTGHTLNDVWSGYAEGVNLKFGIIGNYTTATLYTHAGIFRDNTDGEFKFFSRYDPEITNNIDTTNASFTLGNVTLNRLTANSLEADTAAISSVVASNSPQTGALVVTGGAGIGGNLYVGGSIYGTVTTATNLAGGVQYAVPYQTAEGTTSFVSTNTENQVLTRTINGLEWRTPVTSADNITLGSPTTGSLTDNNPAISNWTTSTKVVDAVDRLNEILGKLVPTQPPNYPNNQSLTISGTTNYRIAVVQGSQVTNGNTGVTVAAGSTISVLRASTFSTPTITGSGPGDSGTLSVTRNGSTAVSKIFTVGNTTQSITATAIGTTLNNPNITISGLSGTLAVGMSFRSGASGAFGGLANNTTYYISAVSGSIVTLATNPELTTPFNGTSTTSGSLAFSAVSDNGSTTASNTTIAISSNTSYPVATPGFWESFDAQITGTSVPAGWNTVRASHSGAGATNTATWYYDSSTPGTPVVTAVSITPITTSLAYSSTIPHYNNGSVFTMTFTCTRLSGDCYPTSDTFVTGVAGGAFAAPASVTYAQAGISTPLAQNLYVSTGSATVGTTASIVSGFGASSTGPTVQVANSYATGSTAFTTALGATVLYKTGYTGSTSVIDETNIVFNSAVGGSTTPAAFRVQNPDGGVASDTPVFTAGSTAFNSTSSTLLVTDATVVGTGVSVEALRHDQTNYSTGYLPVGPNLSVGRSGAQYFTFRFVRSGVSKFSITYTTTTGIGGIWAAMPGTGGISGTTSSLNKWLSLAIDNSLADGCALGGNLNISATGTLTYNISFGTLSSTNATNNEIWLRIRLNSGQSITALYLGASTV